MSKIKVMSETLSNRIAAGEVIERPASVVKELVENSIDAGATFIDVEIERAGSRLIAVTDNGCGMDEEDALLSLEQHGTSKLLDESDLDHILTLGFRGEALPSIASVSRFTLQTRTADNPVGVKISSDGGSKAVPVPVGTPVGTRIEVRDLFFNLPARKKFLKSAATEEHHIEEMLSLLAIGHPETGFQLRIDNRIAFRSPAGEKIEFRLRELFGKSFVEKMLFLEHTEGDIHISGCIAAPGFTRPSRKEQKVFINSRAVEALAVYRGIKEGYSTLAEQGRYNPVILFLEMPPEELDVNVHPAKREVRFKSEYVVSRAVTAAVSAALRQMRTPEERISNDTTLPLSGKLPLSMILDSAEIRYDLPEKVQMELEVPVKQDKTFAPPVQKAAPPPPQPSVLPEESKEPLPAKETNVKNSFDKAPPPAVPVPAVDFAEQKEIEKDDTAPQMIAPPEKRSPGRAAFSGDWPTRIIGVLDKTYIICEAASGLVLIDQHAAHERIMFETILDNRANGKAVQQPLLLPEMLELPRSAVTLLLNNKKVFEQLGFDVESAGGCTVMVNAIPQSFGRSRDIEGLFMDMLHELQESYGSRLPVDPEAVARAACKAAVKAHDELSMPELEKLLSELRECRQGTLCPHGRPTILAITLREIEQRFSRR